MKRTLPNALEVTERSVKTCEWEY